MSEKRRDSKNRILQNGESQRKDGKYEFKYVDVNGVRNKNNEFYLFRCDEQYDVVGDSLWDRLFG